MYDPNMRVMTTPDPFVVGAAPSGFNRYAYVLGDPVNLIDPSGYSPEPGYELPEADRSAGTRDVPDSHGLQQYNNGACGVGDAPASCEQNNSTNSQGEAEVASNATNPSSVPAADFDSEPNVARGLAIATARQRGNANAAAAFGRGVVTGTRNVVEGTAHAIWTNLTSPVRYGLEGVERMSEGDITGGLFSLVTALPGISNLRSGYEQGEGMIDGGIALAERTEAVLMSESIEDDAELAGELVPVLVGALVGKRVAAGARVAIRAVVNPAKWRYFFGEVTSGRAHNIARSTQNAGQFNRVGIRNNAAGRQTLQSHFDDVVQDPSNVSRSWTNRHGSFETRESILAGPGGFVRLETTWKVLADGTRQITTLIPMGG